MTKLFAFLSSVVLVIPVAFAGIWLENPINESTLSDSSWSVVGTKTVAEIASYSNGYVVVNTTAAEPLVYTMENAMPFATTNVFVNVTAKLTAFDSAPAVPDDAVGGATLVGGKLMVLAANGSVNVWKEAAANGFAPVADKDYIVKMAIRDSDGSKVTVYYSVTDVAAGKDYALTVNGADSVSVITSASHVGKVGLGGIVAVSDISALAQDSSIPQSQVQIVSGGAEGLAMDRDYVATVSSADPDTVSGAKTVAAKVEGTAANGHAVWENYVLNVDSTNAAAKVRFVSVGAADTDASNLTVALPEAPRTDAGCTVKYQVLKYDGSAWVNCGDLQTDYQSIKIPVGTGRYRVDAVIIK